MGIDHITSSPRLGWRYALLTFLILIIIAQLVGSLWTLSKYAQAENATYFGFDVDYPGIYFIDLPQIRSQGGVVVTDVDTLVSAYAAGLRVGDVIFAVNGVTLKEHPEALVRAKMNARAGDSLALKWRRGAEEHEAFMAFESALEKGGWIVAGELEIRMNADTMIWMLTGPFVLLAVLFLLAGAMIGFAKPGVSAAFQTAVVFLCIGVYCFYEGIPGLAIWPTWLLALSMGVTRLSLFVFLPLFLRVMAVFPNPSRVGAKVLKHQWVIILLLALVAPVYVLGALALIQGWAGPFSSLLVQPLGEFVLVALCLVGLALWIAQRFEARGRPRTKQRLLEFGLLAAIMGGIWLVFPPTQLVQIIFHPQGSVLPMVLFFLERFGWLLLIAFLPLSFMYAVLAHRVFGIRVILRKGLQHLLVSRGAQLMGLVIVFIIVQQVLSHSSRWSGSVTVTSALAVAVAFVGSIGLRHVNVKLMQTIDRRFFREALDVRHMLSQLSEKLADLRDEEKINSLVASQVLAALHPSRVVLMLKGNKEGDMQSVLVLENERRSPGGADPSQAPLSIDTPLSFKFDDAVIEKLVRGGWMAIVPETLSPQMEEEARLRRMGCELLIAIPASTGLLGVMGLGPKLSEEAFTGEDRELLLTVARQAGMALENAKLVDVAKLEAQHAKELEIARGVQQNLFPKQLPETEGWQFAAVCRPAREVGGDYYDLFEIDSTRVAIALGDVSGKGLGPALMMSSIHAITKSSLAQMAGEPSRFVELLNEQLVRSTSPGMFATYFVGVLDTGTGRLRHVNAGHNPPMVLRANTSEVATLTDGGMLVGAISGAQYANADVHLGDGDLLVIYSDGVTEATDTSGEMFEEERLLETILTARRSRKASEVLTSIMDAVDRFAGDAEQSDDISVMVVMRDATVRRS